MRGFVVSAILLASAYLLLWPVDIDPVAWQPAPAPLDDPRYASNNLLAGMQRIATGIGLGPEAVKLDAQGQLVTGFLDGRLMRFDVQGNHGQLIADTGGRPLGLDFASNGDLIVADAIHGLIRVQPSGEWRVIASQAAGLPINFADDVVVSSQDIAYFSDASRKFGVHQVRQDFFEHRPNGRVLAADLNSGQVLELISGLHFANGVALGPGEQYLLVTETARYRVLRYWLAGDRAGELEVFVDNLPGFPDNITFNGRDRYWLALFAPRTAALDALLPRPFLRKMIWRLPSGLQPDPVMHGFVLGLGLEGEVRENLQATGPSAYAPITSVIESETHLYFGSLSAASLGRLPLGAIAR